VAAPLAEQYVARPAQAAPAGVTKWDQWCTSRSFPYGEFAEALTGLNADLKNRGAEGYEIVTMTEVPSNGGNLHMFYCVRRPIP
jgi:hypothetical protein